MIRSKKVRFPVRRRGAPLGSPFSTICRPLLVTRKCQADPNVLTSLRSPLEGGFRDWFGCYDCVCILIPG